MDYRQQYFNGAGNDRYNNGGAGCGYAGACSSCGRSGESRGEYGNKFESTSASSAGIPVLRAIR